jgi:hypothetical protein
MYRDGRDSARARASRIRASHDYEATELEEMRLRTVVARAHGEGRPKHAWTFSSLLRRMRTPSSEPVSAVLTNIED